MAPTDNLESLFHSLGFVLPDNVKQDITFNLENNTYVNKHYSFVLDLKTRRILSYAFNIYFKSDSFPFSVHAEIQSIVKYYKSRLLSKNKKVLLVVKLSRTGLFGNSKCCLNCMRFIRNNFENLNFKKIYYSNLGGKTSVLFKKDLVDGNFTSSKGFQWRNIMS